MTDRINALTVFLERDIREDDAQPLMEAIRQLRGVLSVQPHIADHSDALAQALVRMELEQKLWEVLHPKGTP